MEHLPLLALSKVEALLSVISGKKVMPGASSVPRTAFGFSGLDLSATSGNHEIKDSFLLTE